MIATTLRARASALWLAWKYVLVCLLALGLSVWLNIVQWRRAITAPLRAENSALTTALDRVAGIAEHRAEDDAKLARTLDTIAGRIPAETVRYVTVAAAAPLDPRCAPGAARVDAVNALLGAEK